jgi:hypothetical protein
MYRCDPSEDWFRNCGGLADRLKGIVSGYIWALMTNRTFLINVNRPCDIKNLYLPNIYNWDIDVNALIKNKNIGYFDKAEVNCGDYLKDKFKYINFNLIKQTKKLIIFLSNRNLLETIPQNKHPQIQKRIKELGFDANKFDLPHTFRYLYNHLFKLTPNLQEKYEKFVLKAKPNKETQLICVQLRIGGHEHHYFKFYYDYKPQSLDDLRFYWKFIREDILPKVNNNNYRLFVTSDNEIGRKKAIEEFGEEKIVYNDGPFNHMDFVENKDDCSHIENTILDFHSFQLCDYAVISHSQFSIIGLWNREDPHKNTYMYNKNIRKFQNDSYKMFHSQ